MPSAASGPLHLVSRLRSHVWWALLLAGCGVLAVAAKRRIDHVDSLTDSPTWSVDAPQRDAASPTGFEHGQRRLIVPGQHTPSFLWIMEAQDAAAKGILRLRHVDFDAPPNGRETRRTSPYRWWLGAVGWIRGALTGDPLGYSIGRGALIADPLLLALMLVAGTIYAARYFGPYAATGFVVGAVSLFPLAANFQPGAPDPHSLAWVLALGSALPLLVPPGKAGARRGAHFIAAGVFGGIAFWNDASVQMPVLLAVVLGAVAFELVGSRGAARPATGGSSWRVWAWTGALTTLAASVFEFAPNHFSWSLDAVSPVHALVWWGLGEVVCAAENLAREGRKGFGPGSSVRLIVAGLAVASWPVIGALTGSGGLFGSDFYALELANHPSAATAANLSVWLRQPDHAAAKWATLLPTLLCFILVARMLLGRMKREERGRLVFILVMMAGTGVLACVRLRWWNFFDSLALAALTLLLAGVENETTRARWTRMATVLLVLPGLFVGFPPAEKAGQLDASPSEAQELIARDFSSWLAARKASKQTVLFSTPVFSTAAAFYGGFDVLVSSDDEDKAGYLAAVRIASAGTPDEVSILFQSHRITDVALPTWDPMLENLVRLGRNVPAGDPLPDNVFLTALLRWGSPVWMGPLDYMIPRAAGLQGLELRAYAIQPPVAQDLYLSRLVDFFLERGMTREAIAVSKTLEDYPHSLAALIGIARADLAVRDEAGLEESMKKIIPYLSRVWARRLPLDRRVSLAVLLVQTRHTDLARSQMTECLGQADAGTLRALPPDFVKDLLLLVRAFGLSFPDPRLKQVALGLVPPVARPMVK